MTDIATQFQRIFGTAPAWIARAPGRANLIGGHTDYNQGYALPMAIDRAIWLAGCGRLDDRINVHSLDFAAATTFATTDYHNTAIPHWARYIAGAWWLLAELGVDPLPGADLVIGGNLPRGAGMSSSAAMGVGAVEMALTLASIITTQSEKARLAVRIENEFMGVPTGNLDQMASACAQPGGPMLLDCRTLDMRPVPLPDAARVWVVDSKKPRELAASGYAERRATCEAVAARLGVRALRDVSLVMLEDARPQLTPVAYKRARHIVTENARVLAMCDALENGALTVAGALLNTAHASLRDDYEISIPEIDFLCARIAAHPAGYGARIMGGGFGGSVVALVAAAGADDLARDVLAAYEGHYGLRAEGFVCTPAAGSACTVYRGA